MAKPIDTRVFTDKAKQAQTIGQLSSLVEKGADWALGLVGLGGFLNSGWLETDQELMAKTYKDVYTRMGTTITKVHDPNTWPKAKLQELIGKVKKWIIEAQTKGETGDKAGGRYAVPYTFLLNEYKRIYNENFGVISSSSDKVNTMLGGLTPTKIALVVGGILAIVNFRQIKSMFK